jgi:hypothetical protein
MAETKKATETASSRLPQVSSWLRSQRQDEQDHRCTA